MLRDAVVTDEQSLVLILGAGASKEVGLPTGEELKSEIARLFREHHMENARDIIAIASDISNESLDEARRHISDSLPQANSIDDFINAHADKPAIAACSKFAITRAILDAERKSTLYGLKHNEFTSFDPTKSSDTWFSNFFKILIENCRLDALPSRLRSVGIINFNYDRCAEHYLFNAIQNYYRTGRGDTADLMRNLDILHPYGLIGDLPWMDPEDFTDFGAQRPDHLIHGSSRGIRTFSESTEEDNPRIDEIRAMVNHGSRLVFLGFAFHSINMELLFGKESPEVTPKTTYASGYGLSNSNCDNIRAMIAHRSRVPHPGVQIRNDLTCATLIQEYRHSLSLNLSA
jgi:hypothetical protein